MNTTANPVDQEFGIDQFAASATTSGDLNMATEVVDHFEAMISALSDPARNVLETIKSLVNAGYWRPAALTAFEPTYKAIIEGRLSREDATASGALDLDAIEKRFARSAEEQAAMLRRQVSDKLEEIEICLADGRLDEISTYGAEKSRAACIDFLAGKIEYNSALSTALTATLDLSPFA
jgi:hypothetical protein